MLSLNLLPPEEKELLTSQATLKKIFRQSVFSLFLTFIFFGLLLSVWLFLAIQLDSVEEILYETETGQRGQAYHALREQISRANGNLERLSAVQREVKAYFPAFEALVALAPESGLTFSRISLNKNSLTLDGHAESRDILISFKSSLEASPYFSNIENPVSNLLKQNNINFSIKMEIR